MQKKVRKMAVQLLVAVMLVTQLSAMLPLGRASAETTGPSLLITEIVPNSSGTGQPYEYVEIYNNSLASIDLAGYQLLYYTSNMSSPANRWTLPSAVMEPGEAMVLWLKKYNYPDVPLLDFNANYGAQLTSEQIVEVMLTTAAQGLHDSALRKVGIADTEGNAISTALINDGEADGIANRSVIYSPSGGMEMIKLRNNETPTPGTLVSGQLTPPAQQPEEPEEPDTPVAQLGPGELLITELVPDTSNFAGYDAFEFIEIYNTKNVSADLKGYTFRSASWVYVIEESLTIEPWDTKVLWTRRGEIAPIGIDGFNSYYFSSYTSKYLLADRLTILHGIGGLTNSGSQTVIVQNAAGTEVSRASYSATDVAEGKSIVYQYPENGSAVMRMLSSKQPPTPGWTLQGQVPEKLEQNSQPPAPPANLTATAGGGSVSLTWTANAEADIHHYRIYKNGVLEFTVPADRHEFTVHALTGGLEYRFEVSAVNTSEHESVRSDDARATPWHQVITQTERAAAVKPGKYAATWEMDGGGPVIPGLAEDVVPQGLAYDAGRGWLLTVSYLDGGRPGTLSIVDADTEALIKSVVLYNENGSPYTGHAGGIAISGEYAWVASETYLYQLMLADIVNAADGDEVRFIGRVSVPVNAAFNTYADGVLWVGEFYEANAYPTEQSHHLMNRSGQTHYAWMVGYRLDEETESIASHPDYILSITGKVQGAALDEDTVYLSTSYGRGNDSVLYRYNNPLDEQPHASVEVAGAQVPVWFLDGQSAKQTNGSLLTVPMTEGIALEGDNLYVLLESGANKYRYTTTLIVERMLKLDVQAWDRYGQDPAEEEMPMVRVSQYMYDAPGSDDGKEYIAIKNYGDITVDLSGYMLGDGINEGGGEGMMAFPAGTHITPGQEIVIAMSGLIFKETYGVVPDFEYPWLGDYRPKDDPEVPDMLATTWSTGVIQLANGGDEVLLMNPQQTIVDFVPYLINRTYRGVFYNAVTAAAPGDGNAIHRIGLSGHLPADFAAAPPALTGPKVTVPISNTLLITEVMYDPLFDETTGEFVEITNISDQPIDISGYYLGDEETEGAANPEGMYNFPEGTVLAPYEVIVIARNSRGIEERHGVKATLELEESDPSVPKMLPNCSWGCGTMQLANTGDEVLLLDRDKQVIDVVLYRAGTYLGIAAHPGVGGGHSIERLTGVDTKNSAADFIDQPNPTPGVLLFGPGGNPDLIPISDLKDEVLQLKEPISSLAAAPTVIDASSSMPEELQEDIPSILMTVGMQEGKLMAVNRNEELTAMLENIAGKRLPVLELNDPAHVELLHELLQGMQLQDVLLVSSNPLIIKELRAHNDEYRGALRVDGQVLTTADLRSIVREVRRSSGLTVLLNHQALTAENVRYLTSRAITVWAYGITTEKQAHRAIALGVLGIESANTGAVAAALEKYAAEDSMVKPPLFIAHRGMNALAPENTMPAFELAVEMKADVIETDVLVTKDGELVIIHDFSVDRTTDGTGKVSELTLTELRQLTANKTDNKAWEPIYNQYPEARIPTLAELLAYARGKDVVLALEMKGIGYEEALVELIEQYDMVTDVYVTSFSSEVLDRIARLNSEIGRGFILDGGKPLAGTEWVQAEKIITDNVQYGTFFFGNASLLTPELISYAKHRGLPISAWTINTKRGMQDLMQLGVQGIITDYAHWMNSVPLALHPSIEQRTLTVGASLAARELAAAANTTLTDSVAASSGIRILDGNEGIVSIENPSRLVALKPGTVTLQRYLDVMPFNHAVDGDAMLLEDSWRIYSAPVTVQVVAAPSAPWPGTGINPQTEMNKYAPGLSELNQVLGRVKLTEQQTVLVLPAMTEQWLKTESLLVQTAGVEIEIPAGVLHHAAAELAAADRLAATIELAIDPISDDEFERLLALASERTAAALTVVGSAVRLSLTVIDRTGESTVLSEFEERITLRFNLQSDADSWLSGLYYIADDGSLTYIGGKVSDGRIEGGTEHFSRYAVLEYDKSFDDIPSGHWAYEVIRKLAAKHIVQGTSTASFSPNEPVTRAQFTALLVRALGLGAGGEMPFQDVSSDKWYAGAIASAYQAGLISGITPESFAPDAPITREQLAVLMVRAYERVAGGEAAQAAHIAFRDQDRISAWAGSGVQAAVQLQLMQGRGEGYMAPQERTTRAESVQALYNLILKLKLLP